MHGITYTRRHCESQSMHLAHFTQEQHQSIAVVDLEIRIQQHQQFAQLQIQKLRRSRVTGLSVFFLDGART